MWLVDFIENLQEKPKHVRVRIMWLSVFVCMLIIFSFWVFSLKYTLKKNASAPIVPQEVQNSVKNIKEQLPAVKNNLGDMKAGIGSLFQNSQEATSSPFE
jgi:hypothetical protein